MPAKVADASVIAAIIFDETRADEAVNLLGNDLLCEPTLLAYELTNIGRKKSFHYSWETARVIKAVSTGLAMNIKWVEVDHLAVCQLAIETGFTAYDASYLYVSMLLDVPLISFDGQLKRF